MKYEWWLKAAISDDTVVAELLLRLKDTVSGDPSSSSTSLLPSWGVRQPRSSVDKKKEKDTPRRSPTTPLSFAGSDGCEDSSGHQTHHRRDGASGVGGGSHSSDRYRSKLGPDLTVEASPLSRPIFKITETPLCKGSDLLTPAAVK